MTNFKPAIITPYYDENIKVLKRCHQSCLAQTMPVRHFFVADGTPNAELDEWDIEHIILSQSHADYGNTPRCLGALSAINLGFNPIIFLDADNWIDTDHVLDILDAKRKNPEADLICTFRHLILPTGILLEPDAEDSLMQHVDTSCLAYFESAFFQLPLWGTMTKPLSVIGDRFIYHAILRAGDNHTLDK